jgi:hypothetical protein
MVNFNTSVMVLFDIFLSKSVLLDKIPESMVLNLVSK